ncbi:MAG: LptF/LptG family permease [Bacteroidales bacterium]|nr:LptF/LptG family permease [Bacteroidales bacterium]
MKKIDRLILRSFLGPLVLTFTIAVFVLLMQFVWKYIDDMAGKGLEFKVIAELLLYASATFVPMALPISTLFASIMTMGNFGERYELVAMKAGGISLRRVMMPMAIVVLLLTGVAFYFANNVMPYAMLKYRTTLYDITRKKPALNIRPSEYYSEIDGYVIRIDEKDSDGKTLRDITIFDHSHGATENNVVVANSGFMQTTPDERYLVFTLKDGCSYNESIAGEDFYPRPFTRVEFDEEILTFDLSSFAFNKSETEFFKGSYQMMNVRQLDTATQQLRAVQEERYREHAGNILDRMQACKIYLASAGTAADADTGLTEPVPATAAGEDSFENIFGDSKAPDATQPSVAVKAQPADYLRQARAIAEAVRSDINVFHEVIKADDEYLNRHYIEWHRKYTLSVACLVLFLIGAPFGSIVRKGGLGLPLVASVIFFVFYYVVGMIAEKAVRESAMGSIGMWVSTFTLLPIGIFLTYKATTDSTLFDAASWKKRLRALRGRKAR